jgi:Family of unknown function (DUF6527)
VAIYKRLSPKLLECSDLFGRKDLPIKTIAHYCCACDELHHFAVEKPFTNGCVWRWDGDLLKPTFSPSMDVGKHTKLRCHYILSAGRVQFQVDCYHDLAGTTIELQDVPASAVEWMKEAA